MSAHKKCVAHIFPPQGSMRGYPCGRPAKFEDRDGWHCGLHSDVAIMERRNKERDRQMERRRVEEQKARDRLAEALERGGITATALQFENLFDALRHRLV